jgi:hypothetical protein
MASFYSPNRAPAVLAPHELCSAAEAFEAALQSLPEPACEMRPYTARQLLARYVIEYALAGERDPLRLRDEALASLVIAASRQAVELSPTRT